jgi:hypothetical protein
LRSWLRTLTLLSPPLVVWTWLVILRSPWFDLVTHFKVRFCYAVDPAALLLRSVSPQSLARPKLTNFVRGHD